MSIVSPGCDSGKNTDYIWVYCMQCKCRRLVTLVSVVRLGAYCCGELMFTKYNYNFSNFKVLCA